MQPLVSIILPTYNRLYSLKEIFLPSLEKQTLLEYELIIVDDASADGTEGYIDSESFKKDFPRVHERTHYYRNNANLGAPRSRNKGVEHANAEWIWIVEDDIQIDDSDLLRKFYKLSQEVDAQVGVISPYLKIIQNQGYYTLPGNDICYLGKLSGEVYFDSTKQINGFTISTHCVTFIRRNLYNQAGGHDGVTFFGNTFRDESDLYFRIHSLGYSIFYAGKDLKAIHRNDFAKQGGQKKVNKLSLVRQEFMLIKNHYLYLKKNYKIPEIRVAFFIIVRIMKHIANLTRIQSLKSILVLLKV